MEIDKRDRSELKAYFVKNAIPTESNFAELIDAALNQKDDGIVKPAGNPLCIEASGAPESLRKAINFYEDFADAEPSWVIALNPRSAPNDPATATAGFSIGDADGDQRIFIDRASGNVGLGTVSPADALDVAGGVRLLSDSNPIRLTSKWSGFPDGTANGAEISNDTDNYKALMIVGNKSAGGVRKVSIWDRLEVNGSLAVTGTAEFGAATRQMIDLWKSQYGIGVQGGTTYFRTNGGFAFYKGGVHHDTRWQPGAGGSLQLAVDGSGNLGIGRTPDRRLAIQGDGRNTELSLSDNLFLDGQGGTVRITNNAYVNNGQWAIKDAGAKAFTVELRDSGLLDLYGTKTSGQPDWNHVGRFDGANNFVQFPSGIRVDGNRPDHLDADGAFYRFGGQVYITVDDNLYIKDSQGGIQFHFDTNAGLLHQQAWQGAALQNGWQNYSGTYNLAGYFKDSMGIVHLRGLVKGGAERTVIFTLPAGYRPPRRELFATFTNPRNACRVDVDTAGRVYAWDGANTSWLSLDGLTFRAS